MYAAIEINIIALIICAGLFIRIKKYNLEVIGSERFLEMLFVLVLVLTSEVFILLFEAKIVPPNYYIHMGALGLYFLGQSFMPYVLFLYNLKTQNISISYFAKFILSLPLFFEVVVIIANFINPFAYVVGDAGDYHRLNKYLLIVIVSIIYIIVDLIIAIIGFIYRKKNQVELYCLYFSIAIIAESALSFAVYGIELYPMITISLLFLFFKLVDKRSDEMDEEACTDSMTGLGNARAYQKKIDVLERDCKKNKIADYAVAVMDINNLKITNDKYGHETGNKLIMAASKCIQECFADCSIYRIGGDEFVALIEGEAFNNRQNILTMFEERTSSYEIATSEDTILLSIAVGMAEFICGKNESYLETFRLADREMYKNKYSMKHQ